ncbi:MAG: hypothetical protein Q8P41_25825 [Pseudomonadota bacterium]|nr:hypothetical protein [Pseudomonadota bacterium]
MKCNVGTTPSSKAATRGGDRLARLLGGFALVAAPGVALASIVIGNPVHGEATAPDESIVLTMDAPVAGWIPVRCDGTNAGFFPVHQVVDLVAEGGFPLPAGTWCRIDAVLEGPVAVETEAGTDLVYTSVIRLLEDPVITGYKLRVSGDSGWLVANVDDG